MPINSFSILSRSIKMTRSVKDCDAQDGSRLGVVRNDDSQAACSKVLEPDTVLDWMLPNVKFDQHTSFVPNLDEERKRSQLLNLFIVANATKDSRYHENPLLTGPPDIPVYAGAGADADADADASLLCLEGYRLGALTLCVIESKLRPRPLILHERQTLLERGALVVDSTVQRRHEKRSVLQDGAQIIASGAHNFLTQQSRVQMIISQLKRDKVLDRHLSCANKERIKTAWAFAHVMNRVCQEAIEILWGELVRQHRSDTTNDCKSNGLTTIVVADLMKKLHFVMKPFPKKVPCYNCVDGLIPLGFCMTSDCKVFRSIINYLANALRTTETKNVRKLLCFAAAESSHCCHSCSLINRFMLADLEMFVGGTTKKVTLVFECEVTGHGIALDSYQNLVRRIRENVEATEFICVGKSAMVETGACCSKTSNVVLGLFAVANQICYIGGENGCRPRETSVSLGADGSKAIGCIFWFGIPLVVPASPASKVKKHRDQQKTCVAAPVASIPTPVPCTLEHNPPEVAVSSTASFGIDADNFTGILNTAHSEAHERKDSILTRRSNRVRRSLVIDDSQIIRKSIGRSLNRLGFDVDFAVNGLEGLRMLQKHLYDVVFCDDVMPVMDGLDCVQKYREWEGIHRPWFSQCIVGISAHASCSDVEKAMKAGMNEFLGKPLTMKHLQQLEKSDKLVQVKEFLDSVLTVEFAHPDGVGSFEETSMELSAADAPTCLIAEPAGSAIVKGVIVR